jgi:hypothetical protein
MIIFYSIFSRQTKKTGKKKIKWKRHTHTHTQRTRFPGVCLYVWGRECSVLPFFAHFLRFCCLALWRVKLSTGARPLVGQQKCRWSCLSRFSLYSPNHIQDVKGPVEFDFFFTIPPEETLSFRFHGFSSLFFHFEELLLLITIHKSGKFFCFFFSFGCPRAILTSFFLPPENVSYLLFHKPPVSLKKFFFWGGLLKKHEMWN